ncbi:DUF2188 domain-containing protein [Alkalicoccobacillus porphyridii]|uniref:DUF2188 domain-containing protein n=1 Tax=Alkalicoccobacillus porphyridii TaxID=2597270 RepID=A0A553ZYS2_9BACI|nr:DUF2188 domain-containing protein [Alkalicoccobacillus porphyridii]TSB46555.1 DUF2188 domain-containing protein [Alkalicoccobacillus porphyridii]
MKEFSVVPNKDATTWLIKAEDVAPVHEFDKRDDAVEKAKELASEQKPSELTIFDSNNEVLDTQVFN